MSDDDKPFECTVSGCGMRFTNEDHLSVHKTKHQLTLTLVADDFKNGLISFVADQTPTPSKFLRNCEEVGLFNDLAKNPFEEAFKKATEQSSPCNDLESSSAATIPSTFETLNTPTPGFLVAVVDNRNVESLQNLVTPLTSSSSSSSSTHQYHYQSHFINTSEHSFHFLPNCIASTSVISPSQQGSVIDSLPSNEQWSNTETKTSQQTSDDNDNNDDDNHEGIVYLNNPFHSGVVDIDNIAAETGCVTYIIANDTLVPLNIPAATMASESLSASNNGSSPAKIIFVNDSVSVSSHSLANSSSSSHSHANSKTSNKIATPVGKQLVKICPTPTLKPPTQPVPTKNGIARTTKERLKATIQQNVQQHHNSSNHGNMKVMSEAVDFVTQQQQQRKRQLSDSSAASSPLTILSWKPATTPASEEKEMEEYEDVVGDLMNKKICLVQVDDEQDDKRRKFLERNRAAAARCRQKKKVWMNSLAIKSEQLEVSNRNMQSEVKQLRKEVQMLRSLLEAHKECPVTLNQRVLKEEMQSDHVTSSSNASTSAASVVIATSDEETAMAALSSMAGYVG